MEMVSGVGWALAEQALALALLQPSHHVHHVADFPAISMRLNCPGLEAEPCHADAQPVEVIADRFAYL
jgi:hypothetical protein